MERKILLTSILITLGVIAFLSGYLLTPEGGLERQTRLSFAGQNFGGQTGLLTDRFSNKVEIGALEDKIPNTLLLSNRKLVAFVNPFSDSKKIVAVTNNGNIVEIDTANLMEKLIYDSQTAMLEAVLSPTGDSVIYSFYATANNKKWVYRNLKTEESTEVSGNIRSAAFSPRGDHVAYLVNADDEGELLISKGADVIKRALKTRLSAVMVAWPSDFISILSYNKNGYGDLFVLKDGEALNKILSYQYDPSVRWSPLGERVVFSAKDDANSDHLFYQDIKNNGAVIDLDANTGASKCVWAGEEEVICGLKNQVQLKDEFYSISLADGIKKLVSTPSINLLTKEMALNQSGDMLFVLNDIDGKLYSLKLK